MQSLRIKGFRSIGDSGEIELKPITAVIGKNSCGKSSFIRFFPLLKQSTEKEISETLLWYGDYVDFGDFKSIKHNFSDDVPTSFEFNLKLPRLRSRYYYFAKSMANKSMMDVKIIIALSEKHISFLSIEFLGQLIEINMDRDKTITNISINHSEKNIDSNKYEWTRESRWLLPVIYRKETNDNNYFRVWGDAYSEREIAKLLERIARTNTKEDNLLDFAQKLMVCRSKKELEKELCKNKSFTTISNYFKNPEQSSEMLNDINTLVVLGILPELTNIINQVLSYEIKNIHYLKPIRASVNRYYRIQGLNIDHVDADGSNLAMILYNLKDEEREKFEKWTHSSFGISFSVSDDSGHASLIIKNKDNKAINLADTGYGYSQILPIIVELWLLLQKSDDVNNRTITVVIEQPELHLHPAFQAKVIDLFANIVQQAKKSNIDIKIIFETHSETMINRLGYLIYDQQLKKQDVNILAFQKNESETTVRHMEFDENGLICDWPVGFFSVEE